MRYCILAANSASIVELPTGEDEALLVRRDALLVLVYG
jgi:hypothetical protein